MRCEWGRGYIWGIIKVWSKVENFTSAAQRGGVGGGGGEGALADVTPHPYTVTCSLGTDAESPGRENMLI